MCRIRGRFFFTRSAQKNPDRPARRTADLGSGVGMRSAQSTQRLRTRRARRRAATRRFAERSRWSSLRSRCTQRDNPMQGGRMSSMRRCRALRPGSSLVLMLIASAACKDPTVPLALPNTAVTPASHTSFPIVSGVHAVACDTCHGGFATFQQFACFNCHGHEAALTGELHRSVAGYSYASTSCLSCHATGSRVSFDHAAVTSTCATCHDSGAPFDPLPVAGHGIDGGTFVHPDKRGEDCASCHVVASWLDAKGLPDGVRDPSQDVVVAAEVPTYSGTSISAVAAVSEPLPMPMFHSSTAVPPSVACDVCHAGAATGAFFPGRLHSSLAAGGLAQPSTCVDCHAGSVPAGFVGPMNAARTPPTGEMKHDAVLWSGGARTAIPAVTQDCSTCHRSPSTWVTSQSFHASVVSQPASCLDCHANSRPVALLTSGNAGLPPGVQFDHSAATGECLTCHGGSFTSWTGARFHLAGNATPSTCLPCHQGERPTSTAGWMSSTFQAAPFDYATHGGGGDCAACHAGPGTGAWGGTQNWAGGRFGHGPTSMAATTCIT